MKYAKMSVPDSVRFSSIVASAYMFSEGVPVLPGCLWAVGDVALCFVIVFVDAVLYTPELLH